MWWVQIFISCEFLLLQKYNSALFIKNHIIFFRARNIYLNISPIPFSYYPRKLYMFVYYSIISLLHIDLPIF